MATKIERFATRVLDELGDDYRKTYESLPFEEQKLVRRVLREWRKRGDSPTLDALWSLDYERRPPTIEEFLNDPQYLHKDVSAAIFPVWRKDLLEVFAPHKQINDWVMTGCIGGGKTNTSALAICYILARLLCLRSPQKFYSLDPNQLIAFGLFAPLKLKVETTSFAAVASKMLDSPFFTKVYPRDPDFTTTIRLPKNIRLVTGSSDIHALGESIFVVAIDEADFMKVGATAEERGQAYKIHDATHRRMVSRFLKDGRLPGMSFLISSKRAKDDYVEQFIEQNRTNGHVKVSDFALWDVKPDDYSKRTFSVMVGDQTHASRIITEDDAVPVPADQRAPPGFDVIHPPIDFLPDFKRSLEDSIRDIGGHEVWGASKFISDREGMIACVDPDRQHPFSREEITIDIKTDVTIEDFLLHSKIFETKLSKRRLRVRPEEGRFIHGDLAVSGDCAGLAMGHAGPPIEIVRRNQDGAAYNVLVPVVYIDFMVRIRPPVGSQIELGKIRQFIAMLTAYGVQIKKITFDGWGSVDMIQILQKQGYESDVLSVDKDEKAYSSLRQAAFERRLSFYEYKPYIKEVLDLFQDPKTRKVDHPLKGSKDVSDAVAGVCWNVMVEEEVLRAAPKPKKVDPRKPEPQPDDIGWLLDRNSRRIVGIG